MASWRESIDPAAPDRQVLSIGRAAEARLWQQQLKGGGQQHQQLMGVLRQQQGGSKKTARVQGGSRKEKDHDERFVPSRKPSV